MFPAQNNQMRLYPTKNYLKSICQIQVVIISIRFQRSDLNSKLPFRTDLGTSQSGQAMYLSVTDGKKGSGPGGAYQQ